MLFVRLPVLQTKQHLDVGDPVLQKLLRYLPEPLSLIKPSGIGMRLYTDSGSVEALPCHPDSLRKDTGAQAAASFHRDDPADGSLLEGYPRIQDPQIGLHFPAVL